MDNNNWNPSSWNLPPAFTNQIYNSNTGNIEQEMDILEFANTPYDFFQNTPFINFNNNPSFIQPKTNNNNNPQPNSSPTNLNSAPTSKNNSKESIGKSTQKRSLSNDSDEKSNKKKLNNSKKALTENEKEKSRNASRDYRKRKKEYIEGLEKKVSNLENEVKKLMQMNEDQSKNLEKERDHKRKFELGRKYQEEWGTNMQKLENLLKDTKDKDADQKIYSIVEHMKILFEKMLNFFKDQYVAQIDFSIFAHFSLFARDSYHFETYGDDTNISVSLINNQVQNIKNGIFTPSYQKQINNNNTNSPSPFGNGNITIGDTTFDSHFSLDGDQDQENYQVEIHKDDEEYVDKILFEEEKVMGLKDLDMSIWTKLTEGLNVSQQVFSKLKLLLNNLRANILKLKIQHAKINTDLSLFIKTEMGDAMKDVGKIVQITAKLGNLQKNYNKYWFIWSTALQDIHSLFTPKQLAYIWVRKSRYLDNCNILNSIWMTLNRQTFSNIQTLPSFIPPFPLPVQIGWQFIY